jgi:hypothetical protein
MATLGVEFHPIGLTWVASGDMNIIALVFRDRIATVTDSIDSHLYLLIKLFSLR